MTFDLVLSLLWLGTGTLLIAVTDRLVATLEKRGAAADTLARAHRMDDLLSGLLAPSAVLLAVGWTVLPQFQGASRILVMCGICAATSAVVFSVHRMSRLLASLLVRSRRASSLAVMTLIAAPILFSTTLVAVSASALFPFQLSTVFAAVGIGGTGVLFALRSFIGLLTTNLAVFTAAPFHRGEYVRIGANEGTVRSVSWRALSMETRTGVQWVPLGRVHHEGIEVRRLNDRLRSRLTVAVEITCVTAARQVAAHVVSERPHQTVRATLTDDGFVIDVPAWDPGTDEDRWAEVRSRLPMALQRAGLTSAGLVRTEPAVLANVRFGLRRDLGTLLGDSDWVVMRFAAGERVVAPNLEGGDVYLVVAGRVALTDDPTRWCSGRVWLGLEHVITGAPVADVVAVDEVVVARFSSSDLRRTFDSSAQSRAAMSELLRRNPLLERRRGTNHESDVEPVR